MKLKEHQYAVYMIEISDRVESAIAREKQIKGWTRAKKNALIATMNPEWKDLAEEWYREMPSGSFAALRGSAAPPAQDDREEEGTP